MLTGLSDLFLCRWCQRPGSALDFARHRVSRSKRGCGTHWVGGIGTLGALPMSTPSFLPPCTGSPRLTLF